MGFLYHKVILYFAFYVFGKHLLSTYSVLGSMLNLYKLFNPHNNSETGTTLVGIITISILQDTEAQRGELTYPKSNSLSDATNI